MRKRNQAPRGRVAWGFDKEREIEIERAIDAFEEELRAAKKIKGRKGAKITNRVLARRQKVLCLLEPKLAPMKAKAALLQAKIYPSLEQDPAFVLAKFAANNLKFFHKRIHEAAKKNDKRFFIHLGRFLSGQNNAELFDPIDLAVTELVCSDPLIKAPEAVRKLEMRGWKMTEEAFRMRKQRVRTGRARGLLPAKA